ncbi:MAG: translation initiation factor IF-3 [Candidatus Brocadia sp. AMX2]|uniref:translation initiation factor IF-3 n=1 Tax=Candidatus Brocadia sinica TaxID=795830 RepID=UPI0006980E07|nr:translation initiation factor IF-3 [Candidatus Brocadia sinica]KAA0245939.1 MAG: translation initiation factor IF-3 [Candidatus Brocadia sp. AMX2]MBC6931323.1 translation initiation factor IF-3 [Candidatus Brocadia sp.]MBL1168670.1 translation initiation factor IF-3 [Candidatus Brocadia sp. AMX1]NOG43270.1 translation initiation factor IF-3 [Planctomycetota bacterium]MCE7866559.1 translation initiation factor IF-3 [Candidatus Brocadia sp. AMX2]
MSQDLRINERIRSSTVRLIDENGVQVGVISKEEAIAKAKSVELDLVEVAPEADPPVCRIMNYGKFKYKQKKKLHQKQHVVQLKELRLRPKTGEHDVQTKIRQARKFLENKDRVLISMMFKGRERAHTELGNEILKQVADALEDIAKVEKDKISDDRRMGIILSPK